MAKLRYFAFFAQRMTEIRRETEKQSGKSVEKPKKRCIFAFKILILHKFYKIKKCLFWLYKLKIIAYNKKTRNQYDLLQREVQ